MKTIEITADVKESAEHFVQYFNNIQYNGRNVNVEEWIKQNTVDFINRYAKSNGIKEGIKIEFINDINLEQSGVASGENTENFKITINLAHLYYGKNNNGIGVTSNEPSARWKSVRNYLDTIMHEMKHVFQRKQIADSRSSINTLKYGKELAIRFLEKEASGRYSIYYFKQILEGEAFYVGSEGTVKLLEGVSNKEIEKYKTTKRSIMSRCFFYRVNSLIELDEDRGVYIDADEMYDIKCDEVIKRYPQVLKELPILQKVYDPNGNRYDIQNLIENFQKEELKITKEQDLTDCKDMYYELILTQLERMGEEERKNELQKIESSKFFNMIEGMEVYIKKQYNDKIGYSKKFDELYYETEPTGVFKEENEGQISTNRKKAVFDKKFHDRYSIIQNIRQNINLKNKMYRNIIDSTQEIALTEINQVNKIIQNLQNKNQTRQGGQYGK